MGREKPGGGQAVRGDAIAGGRHQCAKRAHAQRRKHAAVYRTAHGWLDQVPPANVRQLDRPGVRGSEEITASLASALSGYRVGSHFCVYRLFLWFLVIFLLFSDRKS